MSLIFLIFGSVLLVSLISLVGVFALSVREAQLRKVLFIVIALAAGSMLGTAFFHLVPEAYAEIESWVGAGLAIIAGLLVFFVLEQILHWRHQHALIRNGEHSHMHADSDTKSVGTLVLVADGFHNVLDGFIIAGAYLISPAVGAAVTVSVILHEIPAEIGDFGVLLHSGYTRAQALLWNFLSALTAVVGAGIGLLVFSMVGGALPYMAAFAAGGFLYIASSDLIPEMRKEVRISRAIAQFAALIVGIVFMALIFNGGEDAHHALHAEEEVHDTHEIHEAHDGNHGH